MTPLEHVHPSRDAARAPRAGDRLRATRAMLAVLLASIPPACGTGGAARGGGAAVPATAGVGSPVDPSTPAGEEIRFGEEVAAIVRRSSADPAAREGTMLVGSSILRLWGDAATDLARFRAVNHAFGGARTWELLAYADELVVGFRPRTLVVYCGSNDVNAGEPADRIVERLARFTRRMEAALPGVRIAHLSICRAPQKRARWSVVDEANEALRALCAERPTRLFVDVNDGLADASGEPVLAYYEPDGLHYTRQAYRDVFLPRVVRALDRLDADRAIAPDARGGR
jgi:hypothetical protein